MTDTKENNKYNYTLDITGDVCPLTFVRTKLLLERMKPGETAEVRIQGQMPLENVPRSVRDMGEIVLSLDPEETDGPQFGVHVMVLQKA